MQDKHLYYAVTRAHNQEARLLSNSDLEKLLQAESLSQCFSLLEAHGWGDQSLPPLDTHALLGFETGRVWSFVEELIGNIEPFNVFRYSRDFNNLKAAIKLSYAGTNPKEASRYFMPSGTLDPAVFLAAANSHDFSRLPKPMDTIGHKAYEALSHTGSGQNCDIIVDSGALMVIYEAGQNSGNQLLKDYATLTVDVANIKTAIRSQQMGKGIDFLEQAIPPCGSLVVQDLRRAALGTKEDIYTFVERSGYRQAIPELRQSLAAFERWCDNQLMRSIRPQRHAISGMEPLAAYILARENEIKMVRLILSAKTNNLDPDIIGERMREMYV